MKSHKDKNRFITPYSGTTLKIGPPLYFSTTSATASYHNWWWFLSLIVIEYLAGGRAKIVDCDNDSWYRAHIQQAGRDARGRYIIYSWSLGFVICPQNIDIDDMCLKVFLFKIKKKSFTSGHLKWLVVNSLLLSEAFYATLGKTERGRTQIIINVFFGPSSAAKISTTAWLTVDKGCWWNHPS